MQQLLSIKSVPIAIEFKVTNAQLNYQTKNPFVEISRQTGGFEMKSEPIKVRIDSFEVRQSIGLKSNGTLVAEFGESGVSSAYEATAEIAQNGNMYVNQMTTPQIAAQQSSKTIETVLDFLPHSQPEMRWEGGTIDVNFTKDKLDFQFDSKDSINFNYVPASVRFEIKQLPSVEIEYLGGPMYVPPSAQKHFTGEAIDVKA